MNMPIYQHNVPALRIDQQIADLRAHRTGAKVNHSIRQKLERRIAYNTLLFLLSHGYEPVSLDGDDEPVTFPTPNGHVMGPEYGPHWAGKPNRTLDVMEWLFNLDDAVVHFVHNEVNRKAWVKFTFGNGRDILTDWAPGNSSADFCIRMEAFCKMLDDVEGT